MGEGCLRRAEPKQGEDPRVPSCLQKGVLQGWMDGCPCTPYSIHPAGSRGLASPELCWRRLPYGVDMYLHLHLHLHPDCSANPEGMEETERSADWRAGVFQAKSSWRVIVNRARSSVVAWRFTC